MNEHPEDTRTQLSRRSCLAATGAAMLAAGALPSIATAMGPSAGSADADDAEIFYGHGMVWNRDLPGVLGNLNLSIDLRANLKTGLGSGSLHDPLHPDWNLHFSITSAEEKRVRGGNSRFVLKGVVTDANNPELIGQQMRMLAETRGDTTALAIRIGEIAFGGAGLVVIAIIAILIALLVPAVQKVR